MADIDVNALDSIAVDAWHSACHQEMTNLQGMRLVVDSLLAALGYPAPVRHDEGDPT